MRHLGTSAKDSVLLSRQSSEGESAKSKSLHLGRAPVELGMGTETARLDNSVGGKLPSVAEEDEKPSEWRSWFSMERAARHSFTFTASIVKLQGPL